MNETSLTPEQFEADSRQIQNRLNTHTEKFSDLDKFFIEAEIVVWYYFGKQTEYADIEAFKVFLKGILTEYVAYFDIKDYKTAREKGSEVERISEEYDELIYFGEYNPVKSRHERLETGITIEEQQAKPKGLVLKFHEAVKKIL